MKVCAVFFDRDETIVVDVPFNGDPERVEPVRNARALLDRRLVPSIDDVLDLAEPILKHRMALTFTARAEGESIEAVIARLKARIG